MLLINHEKNAMVFNSDNFDEKTNYVPLIVRALRELDPKKTIHFAIQLEKTPVVFVLYFRKVIQEGIDIKIYHTENSDILRNALNTYQMEYINIKDFPIKMQKAKV